MLKNHKLGAPPPPPLLGEGFAPPELDDELELELLEDEDELELEDEELLEEDEELELDDELEEPLDELELPESWMTALLLVTEPAELETTTV